LDHKTAAVIFFPPEYVWGAIQSGESSPHSKGWRVTLAFGTPVNR
jgi:hypothetical protein